MDHKQAVELQLAAKYVLGELPAVERDEYEDHYIDCPECAKEVHAAATFADTAREVFRQEAQREERTEIAKGRVQGGWFLWLRPAVAVPALFILLALIGYQNLIRFPRAKSGDSAGKAQTFNSFSLVATNVRAERGGEPVKVQVRKNETFALDFDFLPKRKFDHYLGQLQDEAGRSVFEVVIPAEKENHEVHVLVPNGLGRPGEYNLVIAGDGGSKGQGVTVNEVSRMNFVVDFRP